MIHVMLQNEAKPVDQSTVELGSVAISGVGGHSVHGVDVLGVHAHQPIRPDSLGVAAWVSLMEWCCLPSGQCAAWLQSGDWCRSIDLLVH